ncbi:MAG: hypothetical protein RR011_05085 [Oscillospiraceae bacterium]
MSRRQLNTNDLKKFQRAAEKIKNRKATIDRWQAEQDEFLQKNRWMNYLHKETISTLSEEENADLYEAWTTIQYTKL